MKRDEPKSVLSILIAHFSGTVYRYGVFRSLSISETGRDSSMLVICFQRDQENKVFLISILDIQE